MGWVRLSCQHFMPSHCPNGMRTHGNTKRPSCQIDQKTCNILDAISAGGQHTCGITTDNLAYCWGRSDDFPTTVPGDSSACAGWASGYSKSCTGGGSYRWLAISAGREHICGITTGNLAYCYPGGRRVAMDEFCDGQFSSQTKTTAATTLVWNGITPAVQYCFTVSASNAQGYGIASLSSVQMATAGTVGS